MPVLVGFFEMSAVGLLHYLTGQIVEQVGMGVIGNVVKIHEAAHYVNIRLADLHDRERLRSLHRQAVAKGWLLDCEADTLNFFGAAVRARSTAARDPVRVFVDIVRKRRWNHVTQAHEEEGRRQFKDAPVSPRTPDGSASLTR